MDLLPKREMNDMPGQPSKNNIPPEAVTLEEAVDEIEHYEQEPFAR